MLRFMLSSPEESISIRWRLCTCYSVAAIRGTQTDTRSYKHGKQRRACKRGVMWPTRLRKLRVLGSVPAPDAAS
jgi:hypothetical protein